MKNFIENYLKISDYKITLFNGWKDNITAKITHNEETFVIQKTLLLPQKLQKTIEYAINIYNSHHLGFAPALKNQKRFIDYEWLTYSIMECIDSDIIREKDHSLSKMIAIAKHLASIHNVSQEYIQDTYHLGKGKFKHLDLFLEQAKKFNEKNNTYDELLWELMEKKWNLHTSSQLRKGLIHWDPAFKNFMVDNTNRVVWIIDYEMMEFNDYLWDLVDMVRSHMKLSWFQKEEFWELINAYEAIRPLSQAEKENLENYLKMMILDTGTRYFLSIFEESEHYNQMWDIQDSLKKTQRCLNEYDKATLFFK